MQQSVIDTKNRAKESAWRFWQTAFPTNAYDDMLSKGQIPSNTAALGHKPHGKFEPAPAPAYSWRGRTWSDQAGHLQRGELHSFSPSTIHKSPESDPGRSPAVLHTDTHFWACLLRTLLLGSKAALLLCTKSAGQSVLLDDAHDRKVA